MSKLLAPHIRHLRAAGYADNTIQARERILTYADSRLPYGIDTPTVEELTRFFADGGWTGWTLSTYFRHINGFYEWACGGQTPHLSWNPAASLTTPTNPGADPNPATDDELAQALARSNPWWQLAIVLGAYAGLRAGESGRLCREHVTEDFITIWHGKGNQTKKVPTHPEIWRRVEPMPVGILFPTMKGRPVNLTKLARGHFDRIGLPDMHLHRLRAWYATELLRQGADIRTVQELMRHKSITSTAFYTLVTDRQRRFAVGTLPILTSLQQEAA